MGYAEWLTLLCISGPFHGDMKRCEEGIYQQAGHGDEKLCVVGEQNVRQEGTCSLATTVSEELTAADLSSLTGLIGKFKVFPRVRKMPSRRFCEYQKRLLTLRGRLLECKEDNEITAMAMATSQFATYLDFDQQTKVYSDYEQGRARKGTLT